MDDPLNPQAREMADASMVRTLAAQAEAIWPQELPLFRRYLLPDSPRILDAGCRHRGDHAKARLDLPRGDARGRRHPRGAPRARAPPEQPDFLAALGWALFCARGEAAADQAMGEIARALEASPRFDRAYLLRGFMWKAMGAIDNAVSDFEEALACNPDCAEARRELEGLRPLLIESSERIGGTTALSSGTVWIPGNRHMRGLGTVEDPRDVRTYLDALVCERADPALREAFIVAGAQMIEYLHQRTDVRFQPYAASPHAAAGGSLLHSQP